MLEKLKNSLTLGHRTIRPFKGQDGHVLIAGTGRAGTTLLVRLFTRIGLYTGFSDADIERDEQEIGRAGLERSISRRKAAKLPDIIKSPHAVDVLHDGLSQGWLRIDHAIIPVRDLVSAAQSRISVSERARVSGADPLKAAGGLWKTERPEQQHEVLALQFYRVVEALVAHDVPTTYLSFPRFATDSAYCADKLGPLLASRYGLDTGPLLAAHQAEAKPELVTTFERPSS